MSTAEFTAPPKPGHNASAVRAIQDASRGNVRRAAHRVWPPIDLADFRRGGDVFLIADAVTPDVVKPGVVEAALFAGFSKVVAFASDDGVLAETASRFDEAITAGRLTLIEADGDEALDKAVLERVGAQEQRAVFWLDAARAGRSAEAYARFDTLLAAIAGLKKRDHSVLIDHVSTFLRPPAKGVRNRASGQSALTIDALRGRFRSVNPAYRVTFDRAARGADVVAFTVGLFDRDDFATLAATLDDEEAARAAALEALALVGASAVDLPKRLPYHHARLGVLALRRRRPFEAFVHMTRAVALAPESFELLTGLANAAAMAERYGDLETAAMRLVALAKDNPTGHHLLSIAYERTGRLQRASEAAERAVAAAGAAKPAFDRRLATLSRRVSGLLPLPTMQGEAPDTHPVASIDDALASRSFERVMAKSQSVVAARQAGAGKITDWPDDALDEAFHFTPAPEKSA